MHDGRQLRKNRTHKLQQNNSDSTSVENNTARVPPNYLRDKEQQVMIKWWL